MSYPWIIDSSKGTTPSETEYLQVMAPNGLYLNSTTSGTNSNAVLMKGFQEGTANEIYAYYYCDRVRYSPNPWSGETVYSHSELSFSDSTQTSYSKINISGLQCANPNYSTFFQSSNNGTYQTIISYNEDIYITSNSGNGTIYLTAKSGLYLNGQQFFPGGINSITAGDNISIDYSNGQQDPIIHSTGGDVYWYQLTDPNTTWTNIVNQKNGNPQFGVGDEQSLTYMTPGNLYINYSSETCNYTSSSIIFNSTATIQCDTPDGQGRGTLYLSARYVLPSSSKSVFGSSRNPWNEVVSKEFTEPSDIKLKEDIQDLDVNYSIELIKKINPVSYIYIKDTEKKKHFGVIAQDIEKIIGDENLALHSKHGEYQGVNYMELISPLIKTVQDLLKKVENLEKEIQLLKT